MAVVAGQRGTRIMIKRGLQALGIVAPCTKPARYRSINERCSVEVRSARAFTRPTSAWVSTDGDSCKTLSVLWGERTVDAADSARLDGPFFLVRRWYPDLNRTETVVTLRSEDVLGAEVLKDGVRIDYIPGCGQAKT